MLSLQSPDWKNLHHAYGSAADIPVYWSSSSRNLQQVEMKNLGFLCGAHSPTRETSTLVHLLLFRT